MDLMLRAPPDSLSGERGALRLGGLASSCLGVAGNRRKLRDRGLHEVPQMGAKQYFSIASNRTAPMIIPVVSRSHGLVPIPNTVPAAGGCSVSVMAMARMSSPTDTARLRFRTGDKSSRKVSTVRQITTLKIPSPILGLERGLLPWNGSWLSGWRDSQTQ